jgi:hypothetical protein
MGSRGCNGELQLPEMACSGWVGEEMASCLPKSRGGWRGWEVGEATGNSSCRRWPAVDGSVRRWPATAPNREGAGGAQGAGGSQP